MSDEQFDRFKKCAVEVVGEGCLLGDLGLVHREHLDADSLDLVEFVMALEEEFDITVEEEELDGVDTVGQAFELVSSKL